MFAILFLSIPAAMFACAAGMAIRYFFKTMKHFQVFEDGELYWQGKAWDADDATERAYDEETIPEAAKVTVKEWKRIFPTGSKFEWLPA